MSRRKLIGLTGPSSFSQECKDMIEKFFKANYVSLDHHDRENLDEWLPLCDAVILAGGVDIHPSVYKDSVWNNVGFTKFDIKRDERELVIADFCVKNQKPILGICRGHQLLGVYHGLKLMADISSSSVCHSPQRQQIQHVPIEPMHKVKLVEPLEFRRVYQMPAIPPEHAAIRKVMRQKSDELWVNSFHHQGVKLDEKVKYAEHGIKVVATGRIDYQHTKEIIEMMEGTTAPWISVQFHPEYDYTVNSASYCVLDRFARMINGEG